MNNESNKEIWKAIPGYEGYYEVSNMGRVKSLERVVPHSLKGKKTIREKILSSKPSHGGYVHVMLYKDGQKYETRVHALVLLAFVGPRKENQESLHLEPVDINHDNSLNNLRYGSSMHNSAFTVSDGRSNAGIRHPLSKLTDKDVREIKKMFKEGIYTDKKIGEKFKVSRQTICGIKNHRNWTHI